MATRERKKTANRKAVADRTKPVQNMSDQSKASQHAKYRTSQELKPSNNKKRTAPDDIAAPHTATKRPKRSTTVNSRPSQKLDIFVCGDGESGELGLGAVTRGGKKPTGVRAPRLNDLLDADAMGVVQIAVGGLHCVALTHDSKILTWGVNDDGALGRDTTWEPNSDCEDEDDIVLNPRESSPTAIPAELFSSYADHIAQVAATDSASFALTADGFVYGWGTFKGNEGTIGFSPIGVLKGAKSQDRPTLIPHLKNITTIAAGSNHVLALNMSGEVFAWGGGQQSQLGRRRYSHRFENPGPSMITNLTPSPIFLPGKKIIYISCGSYHSFAIDDLGRVYAWGLNNFGQTGVSAGAGEDGAVIQEPTVVQNLEPYRIQGISGGNHHSIANTKDGTVLVWGRCDDSQMGIQLDSLPRDNLFFDERNRPRILSVPTRVPDVTAFFVTAGIDNSIAISMDGKAYSWGFSANYRTGLRTEDSVQTPTLVDNTAIHGRTVTFAGCGGQSSVLASPANL